VLPIVDPEIVLTAYAVTRRGRSTWPPLRLLLDRLRPQQATTPSRIHWPLTATRPAESQVNVARQTGLRQGNPLQK
jgi:hypothetical protein